MEAIQQQQHNSEPSEPTGLALRFHVIRWAMGCFLMGAIVFIVLSDDSATAGREARNMVPTTATGMHISRLQDMKFGTLIRSNAAGTATISVNGARSISGSIVALGIAQGIYCQAQFSISKECGSNCTHDGDNDGDNDHDGDNDDNDIGDHGKPGGKKSITLGTLDKWGYFRDDKDDSDHDDHDDHGGSHANEEFDCDNVGITLPTSITLSNGAGGTMTVDQFTKRLNTAQTLLDVGARLNIKANQPSGTYSGTFSVTAVCE
jgi:hypothetical protein